MLVAKKYNFEYPEDKAIELSKKIKVIVDDKAKYTDWSRREDIKAELKMNLIHLGKLSLSNLYVTKPNKVNFIQHAFN